MGLLPLEYSDCLTDTPHYRENLRAHEKELERTSQAIKGLIKEVKDLLTASKTLSKAQRSLATTLINFRFDCIGCSLTDDEIVIAGSLKEFGRLLCVIEDERDRMLNRAEETLIKPIEDFRKENIGAAKEGKKKFDKETARYCQSLERRLNLSTKKNGNLIQEADASLELEQRHFFNASLDYALLLTEIQEKKKFEFVETILSFMGGMMTFYHQGYEVANEYKPYMNDLLRRIQRTRENFEATHSEAEQLKQRTLEKNQDPGILNKMYTRQGYLFLMEKKALSTTWTKHFCQYQKTQKKFSMMPYSQTTGKISNGETITIKECFRRQCDSIDKRFCFDVIAEDRPPCTFQAMSDEDCRQWLDAMDGNEPTFNTPGKSSKSEEFALDDLGFDFVRWCINYVESRGLTDQGLYRLVGVNSKVSKLTQMALDKRNYHAISGDDEWEIKTVTSALKNFFRNLPEPLLTFRLHGAFITAAKQENKVLRVNSVHSLVHTLPNPNFRMLEILIKHLCKIAKLAEKNLMTVSNLGVCFGPTLLRSEEETLAAIIDIKFGNVVVEILIENCEKIFGSTPELNGARRPSQPPPYVSPPRPLRRELPAEYRTSMGHSSIIRTAAPENCNNRGAPPQSSYLTNSSQITFPATPHPVMTEDKKSQGLIIYNPVWSDGPSLSTNNCSTFTGPPMPPLPEQETSGLYPALWPDIHRAESISVHRLSNTDIGDKGSNREFYASTEVLPEIVCGQVTNPSSQSSGRRVRTLYACRGENDMELSFEPNEIICNVQFSQEPGWIHGTLRGKTGLIPRNYVTFIP